AKESALGTFTMEDLRQPAAQPGAGRADPAPVARVDVIVAGLVLDLVSTRDPRDSSPDCLDGGGVSKTARCSAPPASGRRGAIGQTARISARVYTRMPALRGLLQSRRNPAHGGTHAVHPQAAARVDAVGYNGQH